MSLVMKALIILLKISISNSKMLNDLHIKNLPNKRSIESDTARYNLRVEGMELIEEIRGSYPELKEEYHE